VENRFINQGVQPIQGPKDVGFPPFNQQADPQLLADAQAMVLRDRNHPSVVIWSLCNEGGCQIGATTGASIGTQFKNVITYADTTRPITANGEWSIGTSDTMTNVMDVVTCSYNYGEYSQFHYTHPYKPIMGGESASCTTDRGYYGPTNATSGHMNSDDDGCVVSAWASAASNPWDSGNFVRKPPRTRLFHRHRQPRVERARRHPLLEQRHFIRRKRLLRRVFLRGLAIE
jgi:hypothetical protein